MNRERHLKPVETIGPDIDDPVFDTIEQGIEEAISAGRMTPEMGKTALNAYRRTRAGMTAVPDLEPDDPEFPDGAA